MRCLYAGARGRSRSSQSSEASLVRGQSYPRNYLDQTGYHDVGMAVFRNFKYGRYNLQARFESTNLFSMVNLDAPTATLTSSLFGHINSASGARELQLGLRLTFQA